MKQMTLDATASERKTKRQFLDEMNMVVPWAKLVALMAPHEPRAAKGGLPPLAVETMLRIHFL